MVIILYICTKIVNMTPQITLSIAAAIIFLLAIVVYLRKQVKLQGILQLLVLSLGILLLQPQLSPQEGATQLSALLIAFAASSYIAGHFLENKTWRLAIPFALLIILAIAGKNTSFAFGDYVVNLGDIKVFSILIFGFLAGLLGWILSLLLQKLFDGYQQHTIQLTAQTILLGVFAIPATFFASTYGLILMAVGLFAWNAFTKVKIGSNVIALTALASISYFTTIYNLEGVDLTVGKIIAGLFIGAGAYSLVGLATRSANKLFALALMALAITSVAIITLLNNIHPAYGGVESFIATLIGFGLATSVKSTPIAATILFPAMVILGIQLPSDPFQTEDITEQVSTTQNPEAVQAIEPAGIDPSVLTSLYQVEKESAIINFQLGPKGGVTKGKITAFEGNVDLRKGIENAQFSIKINASNLSTFNSMRDESVHGKDYLNVSKFPLMTFTSQQATKKDDGYLLNGKFTLLGKTNSQEVFVKYIGEKEGKHLFTGKSSLDRTTFGMKSSPQEGNVVDFTFEIALTEK